MNPLARAALLLPALLFFVACSASPPPKAQTQSKRAVFEITQMFNQSAEDWTNNDLDGFMQSFHNSEDLRFVTPGGITMGWDNLRDRYAKSITKSDLRFSDIDITVLTPDTALAFARFHNDMKDGGYGTGLTTLLMQNIDGKWVITHDHSSGLPADYPAE